MNTYSYFRPAITELELDRLMAEQRWRRADNPEGSSPHCYWIHDRSMNHIWLEFFTDSDGVRWCCGGIRYCLNDVTAITRQVELAYGIRVIAEGDERMLYCFVCGRRNDDVEEEYWEEYNPPLTADDFCAGSCGEPERA